MLAHVYSRPSIKLIANLTTLNPHIYTFIHPHASRNPRLLEDLIQQDAKLLSAHQALRKCVLQSCQLDNNGVMLKHQWNPAGLTVETLESELEIEYEPWDESHYHSKSPCSSPLHSSSSSFTSSKSLCTHSHIKSVLSAWSQYTKKEDTSRLLTFVKETEQKVQVLEQLIVSASEAARTNLMLLSGLQSRMAEKASALRSAEAAYAQLKAEFDTSSQQLCLSVEGLRSKDDTIAQLKSQAASLKTQLDEATEALEGEREAGREGGRERAGLKTQLDAATEALRQHEGALQLTHSKLDEATKALEGERESESERERQRDGLNAQLEEVVETLERERAREIERKREALERASERERERAREKEGMSAQLEEAAEALRYEAAMLASLAANAGISKL
jgi:chromosome segregation ATPase